MRSDLGRAVRSTALTLMLSVPMGAHAFAVTSSDPADGAVLTSKPPNFVINLDAPYAGPSVQNSDLTIDGVAADGLLTADADTLYFSYLPALNPGIHIMSIAQGAIESSSGSLIDAFSARFEIAEAPEPATLALFGLGLTGLALSRRKRS